MDSGMFEIYTKEVVILGKTYRLRPLSGRFLPKLYSIIGSLDIKEGEENEEQATKFLRDLGEPGVEKLHLVCLETFKKSYPDQKEELLDDFVSQNLMQLFPTIIELNLNAGKKD